MSQSTRLFGSYISGVTIGGTSFLAVSKSIEEDWEYLTQMATALKDAAEYPIGIREKWSVTGVFYISTANTSGEGGPGGSLWTKALAKATVAVSFVDNATSGAGNTISGNALITRCRQTIQDQAQEINITLSGQGVLSSAIA